MCTVVLIVMPRMFIIKMLTIYSKKTTDLFWNISFRFSIICSYKSNHLKILLSLPKIKLFEKRIMTASILIASKVVSSAGTVKDEGLKLK